MSDDATPPKPFDPAAVSWVASMDDVRAGYPRMLSRAELKVMERLDRHCCAIIGKSTFCIVATYSQSGADVSPRGDPAGFVRVLDDRHLLIPDRVGNNRLDSMANLFLNPAIGLLFLVPGMAEVLRVNGQGRVTDDAGLLAPSTVQGRAPKFGIVVELTSRGVV